MKRVLLTLLIVIVAVAALGAAGFAGYHYGYSQGALATSNTDSNALIPGPGWNPHGMPMHGFGNDRGFGRGEFGMMERGRGMGFFSPIRFLVQVVFWALVAWALYTLVTRSGWRLTKTQPAPVAVAAPDVPAEENKETTGR